MDNDLKIFAGLIVTESKMTKASKLQLLNFIQNEATIPQIKALLLDGEIVNLDKQAEEIVNSRFEVSERSKAGTLRKSAMGLAGAGGGMSPAWLLYRTIRSAFSKCTKICGTYQINTVRRHQCMDKCKADKDRKIAAAKQKVKS